MDGWIQHTANRCVRTVQIFQQCGNGNRPPSTAFVRGRIPRHRHPREDPREDVGVGVDVGVVECGPNSSRRQRRVQLF